MRKYRYKLIEGTGNQYIRDDGKVFYKRKGKLKERKLAITNMGYYKVGLIVNGKQKGFSVHRLVAQYFIEKVEGKELVNHIDLNKLNNRVENLEWVTPRGNAQHAKGNPFYQDEVFTDLGYYKGDDASFESFCKEYDVKPKNSAEGNIYISL